MVNIVHRIGIKAPIAKVYAALATTEGVAGWWTRETTGVSKVGDVLTVRFTTPEGQEKGVMKMKVTGHSPSEKVEWKFTEGPPEWIGTDVVFRLKEEGGMTLVLFSHNNWKEEVEFTYHCSMKWATFLFSLRDLVETGAGKPSPGDLKIDNWN